MVFSSTKAGEQIEAPEEQDLYAYGMRAATATTPGATMFTHPTTGEVAYGAPVRPGVDVAASSVVNQAYGSNAYIKWRRRSRSRGCRSFDEWND